MAEVTRKTADMTTSAEKKKEIRTAATKVKVHRTVILNDGGAKDEESKEEESLIEIHRFETEPAIAKASVPIKMSKNYQSIGVEIGVELPCYVEELPEAIDKAYQMAMDRVAHEIPELRAALDRLS